MTRVTPTRDLKGYLEPGQVKRLIAVTKTLRDLLLILIPWRTGIKVGELIRIQSQDIDFEKRTILIKVQKTRKRDNRVTEKVRLVPVDRETINTIRQYLEWRKQFPYEGDLLFPISRQRINQIYWQLGMRAGLNEIGDPAVSKHSKLHPYTLRHSFAIHCIKHGMSIERLQKILGLQSPTTASIYLQHSLTDLHDDYDDYDRVWENEGKH